MFRSYWIKAAISSCLLFSVAPSFVWAQENADPYAFRGDNENTFRTFVVDPFQYRGEPIFFNSFIIRPNVTLELKYDDNILATEDNTQSDFVTVLSPSLSVQKEFGRHNFIFSTSGQLRRFLDQTNENIENFQVGVEGNFEAMRGLNIPVSATFRSSHFDRKDQKVTDIANLTTEPLGIKAIQLQGGINYQPNRFGIEVLGTYREARLDNGTIASTGEAAIRDVRDVNTKRAQIEVSYEMQTGFRPFFRTVLANEDFINEVPGSLTRNNDLLRLLGGSSFDFKGILYGYLGAGWERRTYDEETIDDATAISLEGDIFWEPIEKVRMGLQLGRSTSEENTIVTGLTETTVDFNLDYELQRDLFTRVIFNYENEDFTDLNREDDTYELGAELLYIVGPQLQVGIGYLNRHRDSTAEGLGLDNNIFTIRAQTGF